MADIEAIQARVNAATEGPWSADATGTVCADADLVSDGDGGLVLPMGGPMEVAECYRSESPKERGKNADFIAHARTDIPALLEEIAALQAERDVLRDKVAGQEQQIGQQRLLIAKIDEFADRIWRSGNSAYRKAGRDLLEMLAIAQEKEKK